MIQLYKGYGTLWFGEEIDPTGEPIRTGSDFAPPIAPLTRQVHKFSDESTQSDFLRASQAEFSDRLNKPSQYWYEGIEFEVPSSKDSNTQLVYCYENEIADTYFYTLESPEQITSNFPVLESDGIAFCAFAPLFSFLLVLKVINK